MEERQKESLLRREVERGNNRWEMIVRTDGIKGVGVKDNRVVNLVCRTGLRKTGWKEVSVVGVKEGE